MYHYQGGSGSRDGGGAAEPNFIITDGTITIKAFHYHYHYYSTNNRERAELKEESVIICWYSFLGEWKKIIDY